MIKTHDFKMAVALTRCLEAQPHLKKFLDLSALFSTEANSSTDVDLLIKHMQELVYPREAVESEQAKEKRLIFVSSLVLNKYAEQTKKH